MTDGGGRLVHVVEDDPKIAAVLCDYLRDRGYRPVRFADGGAALDAARATPPSLMILDLMLPGMGGLAVCRRLRSFCAAPVLMVTARVSETDRVAGLEAGADDYVCKPFGPRELMARVGALIRRAEGRVGAEEAERAWRVDEAGLRAAWKGVWLSLSASEFQILAALMRRPGRVFTRDQLLDQLGSGAREVSDRAVDSHVKNIRRKLLEVDPQARCLASVYGVGYRFDPDAAPSARP